MRTKSLLRNSLISIICQIITVVLAFIARKIFVLCMDIEYLGYESLFSNVLNLLSIAEMGIGNVIVFNLYREIANDNVKEIQKLVSIYKLMYRVVAGVVTIAGIVMIPFLPLLINGEFNATWGYIRCIYVIQLFGSVSSYFLSYRRTVFIADQKEYKCAVYDVVGRIALQISQIFILIITHSFILYLLAKVLFNILTNILIYLDCNKNYPYLKVKQKITIDDIRKYNVFKDTRDFLVHKLANAVFSATDNIVISSVMGIRMVALFGNYYLIQNTLVTTFLYKLLNPLKATIGNLEYSCENVKKKRALFNMCNMVGAFLAIYVSISLLTLYQPFIRLWLGEEYLLPYSFVVAESLSIYVQISTEVIYMFRSVYGDFFYDRKYMIYSAISNFVISIIFSKIWGITGIVVGTIIGLILIWFGRMKFVFWKYTYVSKRKYLSDMAQYLVCTILIAVVCVFATSRVPCTWLGFIVKALITFVIVFVVLCAAFHRTEEFKSIVKYVQKMIKIILFKKEATNGDN